MGGSFDASRHHFFGASLLSEKFERNRIAETGGRGLLPDVCAGSGGVARSYDVYLAAFS
jgi:hypothetical protein